MIFNRRGFLLGEFSLKTVIAIFSILLLVFLLVKIYFTFESGSDIDKAKASVEKVSEIISLVSNSGKEERYVLVSPRDWSMIYFGTVDLKPSSCQSRNCLCICEKIDVESCQSNGFCQSIDKELIISEPIKISSSEIVVKEEGGKIIISR